MHSCTFDNILVYLARSQFGEKGERAGTGPRLRSGSGPSGVKCSESEPSNGGLFLSDDRPLMALPDGCNDSQPSLLELFDLRQQSKEAKLNCCCSHFYSDLSPGDVSHVVIFEE